jgi:probable HAF family extracellular repeat protein
MVVYGCPVISGAPEIYHVTDLGMPTGAQLIIPTAVNSGNQIAGLVFMDDDSMKGFYWQKGRWEGLGSLGGRLCVASGINDSGQVVGVSQTSDQVLHGFLWQNGRMRDLSRRPGEFTAANSINDRGQITGWALNERTESIHATLWQDNQPKDLGALPGDSDSIAAAINGNGDIVGYSTGDYENWRPFLYQNGRIAPLAIPGKYGYALGINDSGQAVGAIVKGEYYRAFLTQNGRSAELGSLGGQGSLATGINNAGQVVGMSETANGELRAFLWQSGKMVDLNSRISSGSNWVLLAAYSIGKRGQIVGLGILNGEMRAFLLTPDQG